MLTSLGHFMGFPGGAEVKDLPANAGDAREYPGGLLRLDPAFAYAEPPSS